MGDDLIDTWKGTQTFFFQGVCRQSPGNICDHPQHCWGAPTQGDPPYSPVSTWPPLKMVQCPGPSLRSSPRVGCLLTLLKPANHSPGNRAHPGKSGILIKETLFPVKRLPVTTSVPMKPGRSPTLSFLKLLLPLLVWAVADLSCFHKATAPNLMFCKCCPEAQHLGLWERREGCAWASPWPLSTTPQAPLQGRVRLQWPSVKCNTGAVRSCLLSNTLVSQNDLSDSALGLDLGVEVRTIR